MYKEKERGGKQQGNLNKRSMLGEQPSLPRLPSLPCKRHQRKFFLSHNKMLGGFTEVIIIQLTVGLVVDASFLPKTSQLLSGERTNVLCLVVQVEPFPSIISVHCFVFFICDLDLVEVGNKSLLVFYIFFL